jgi:transposase, IS5 family
VKRSTNPLAQLNLKDLRQTLDEMMRRVKQVMKQTRARIYHGDTRSQGKLLSVFEHTTEIIRKDESGKPNEFGKMVKLQELENHIVIDFEVYDRWPSDSDPLVSAIDVHQAGPCPILAGGDAAFYSGKNEAAAKAKGVKRMCVPNISTKNPERRREQKKRWFRRGRK